MGKFRKAWYAWRRLPRGMKRKITRSVRRVFRRVKP